MRKEDLRIVFLGTPDFAVESLDSLVKNGFNIVGVVTMPDKPAGRGHKLLQSPVKQFALANDLHIMQPVNLKDQAFIDELQSLNADLFIVIAFRMLPKAVWMMPRLGTFNLHASLLPKYRGAAPINWAVINGDTETGVTTFFLKHEIDTGDILRQEKIQILPSDNVGTVHDKLMHLGAELTIDTVQHILDGDLKPIPQDMLITAAGTEPTPAPKIFTETCKINWEDKAESIHNLVRGLSPYPAAWTLMQDGDQQPVKIKIFETALSTQTAKDAHANLEPGKITIQNGIMSVDCADNRLQILSLQPEGKKRMPVNDYLRGAHLNLPRFVY